MITIGNLSSTHRRRRSTARPGPSSSPQRFASVDQEATTANTLAWHGIECHVPDSSFSSIFSKRRETALLQDVAGSAQSGDFIAIVSPSGAGKTTLFDILTRRKTVGRVGGMVTYNGRAVATAQDLQPHAAYVMQEESFHATSTVMEAMLFQAHMWLPRTVPTEAKRARALRLLKTAGLQGKEDMRIGGKLPGGFHVRGLSGGERRRLSLCCGVVADPHLLCCDEVTSGLDSMGALQIAGMLHGFCAQGMVVLCAMHQPRQAIWRLMTKMLVLSKGHQLFYGPPTDAEAWFTRGLGLIMPPDTTPAENEVALLSAYTRMNDLPSLIDKLNEMHAEKPGIWTDRDGKQVLRRLATAAAQLGFRDIVMFLVKTMDVAPHSFPDEDTIYKTEKHRRDDSFCSPLIGALEDENLALEMRSCRYYDTSSIPTVCEAIHDNMVGCRKQPHVHQIVPNAGRVYG